MMLWSLVLAPLLLLVALLAIILRRRRLPEDLTTSDILNLGIFVLATVSIFIAVNSYRHAVDSAEEQGQTLNEQRKALESAERALDEMLTVVEDSRSAAESQVTILEGSRTILEESLATANQHREAAQDLLELQQQGFAAEQARLARRPRLEFDLSGVPWITLQTGKPVGLPLKAGSSEYELVITFRNVGDDILAEPVILYAAEPNSVSFEPPQATHGLTSRLLPTTTFRIDLKQRSRFRTMLPPST